MMTLSSCLTVNAINPDYNLFQFTDNFNCLCLKTNYKIFIIK